MNVTSPFAMLLQQSGQSYDVERNSHIIFSLTGLSNHEKSTQKAYIGFPPESDIKTGDWLINSAGERFYVNDTVTDYFMKNPNQLKAFYLTEVEFSKHKHSSNTTIFNIGTATGSVIGTQSVVNMNYQNSVQQLHDQIAKSNSPDKEQLEKIVSTLELIVNGDIPAQKGILSKFSAAMERNSWITGAVASTLLSWLTAQIH